jgi:hypothetical protein
MLPGFQVVAANRYLTTWDSKKLTRNINEDYRAKDAGMWEYPLLWSNYGDFDNLSV